MRIIFKRSHGGGQLRLVLTVLSLIAGVCCAAEHDDFAAGPLLSRFPLTLDAGERTEALGPLFYKQQLDTEDTIAFPPFYSHVLDPVLDS